MKRPFIARLLPALLLLLLATGSSTAFAQATRTWVSGVGDDANPCSRTAPCKTWAGAISKTAPDGEIDALDPGGFGGVTITKSITLDGGPGVAGILVSGTNGITINAGATDVVSLRNLDINGLNNGASGIRFLNGGALHIDHVIVYGFAKGIDFEPAGNSDLYISDSMIQRNTGVSNGGIFISPGVSGSAFANLDNVRVEQNNYGLRLEGASSASARNSVFSGNTGNGVLVYSPAGATQVSLDTCTLTGNGSDATAGGAKADGAGATIRVSKSQITDNTVGFLPANGGHIISYGNNQLAGNASNGAPTSTVPGL